MSFGMIFGFLFFLGITTLIVLGIIALLKVITKPKYALPQQPTGICHCSECGNALQENWKYCPNCGTGLPHS